MPVQRGSTCPECFQEAVQKEDRKRLAWFVKNYEKLAAENRKPRKKYTDGILWEELSKKRAETAQTTPRYAKVPKAPPLPKADTALILETMKPVPPEVHDLIYQGISAENEGRQKYLTLRYKEDPDDKFYMKECSNWEYGWGINSYELHKLVKIPRVQVIKQSFYRRGGVERDPDHYREAVNMESPIYFPTL